MTSKQQHKDYIKISKALSYHLRHKLVNFGSPKDGFVNVADIQRVTKCSLEDIEYVVNNCEKQRFCLRNIEGTLFIRANQGHTKQIVDANKVQKEIDEPLEYCVHGTYTRHLASIIDNGLNKMSRDFIHFASHPDAKSGCRKDCDILIGINMERAIKDGIKFYMSENNVILTSGVNGSLSSKYFSSIRNVRTNENIDFLVK
jgi:2'-phosphotransferase